MATFGERLKELRITKGLTQEELANIFHTNKSSISRYEQDEQKPNDLESYAEYFNVTVDYLLGRSEAVVYKEEQKKIKSWTMELLEDLIRQGVIKDPNNISEDTIDMIIDAIRLDAKRLKKDINI